MIIRMIVSIIFISTFFAEALTHRAHAKNIKSSASQRLLNVDGTWNIYNPFNGNQTIRVSQNGAQFQIQQEISGIPGVGIITAFADGRINGKYLNFKYRYSISSEGYGSGNCVGFARTETQIAWNCSNPNYPSFSFNWDR